MSRTTITNPNPQACLSCRSKHLKCDAKQPVCSRCTINHLECVYVRSKRGYVGGRRRKPLYSPQPSGSKRSCDGQLIEQVPVSQSDAPASTDGFIDGVTPGSESTIDAENQGLSDIHNDRLVRLYYQKIHPAHPFLVPRKLLSQDPDIIPTHLWRAIRFIASPLYESCSWNVEDFRRILDACSVMDAFRVQTLILLTIAAYAHGERVQGNEAMRQASETAHHIGLDSDYFGTGNSPVLRESWRRTWWELYSLSGMLRVITPSIPRLRTLYTKLMPCHDVAYQACEPTQSRTLDQMQQRHFAEDHFRYSSFAYRVESIRILIGVLDFASQDSQEVQASSAFNAHKASIRSYILSLPANLVDLANMSDELMFCALSTINLASILLNLPRSNLPVTRSFKTICQTKRPTVFTHDNNCTTAAIDAADSIVQLLINRSSPSIQSSSPCFSCVLTFAAIVHLRAYCHGQDQERLSHLREYFQVSLGSLNSIGQIWPVARIAKGQLAEFAREIFVSQTTSVPQIEAEKDNPCMTQPLEPFFDTRDDLWLQEFVNAELDLHVPA